MAKQWSLFLITVLISVCSLSDALADGSASPSVATFTLEDLDPEHAWWLQDLTFEGNTQLREWQLGVGMVPRMNFVGRSAGATITGSAEVAD